MTRYSVRETTRSAATLVAMIEEALAGAPRQGQVALAILRAHGYPNGHRMHMMLEQLRPLGDQAVTFEISSQHPPRQRRRRPARSSLPRLQ